MRILAVLAHLERDRHLADLALAVAGDDEVVLASVLEVGTERSLAAEQPQARARRRELDTLAAGLARDGARVRPAVAVARRGWDAVVEMAQREDPELLVLGWRWPDGGVLGTTIDQVLGDPPCDVAIVRGSFAGVRRVLVPVRGGRYAHLAVRLSVGFARRRDARLTLLHVSEPDRRAGTGWSPADDDDIKTCRDSSSPWTLAPRNNEPSKGPPALQRILRDSAFGEEGLQLIS